jgi:hypothetical protein
MAILIAVAFGLGFGAVLTTIILIIIEITFSFDNAIINAKTLGTLSPFWQKLFLTLGIVIAIFGMRIIFPVVIVMITAHLPASEVIRLALRSPHEYAEKLHHAHTSIATFGGIFLLMLAVTFFLDDKRKITWLDTIEKPLQRLASWWMPLVIGLVSLGVVAVLPSHHRSEVISSGLIGIVVFEALQLVIKLAEKLGGSASVKAGTKMGIAAFATFIYLEILDASFSFDGVIGAFAITSSVILIAAGLGAGAVWVRSFTVLMVKRGTLDSYKYLEHGAHYTVLMLAALLLASILVEIPDAVSGIAGVVIIGLATRASITERNS